MKSIVSYNLNGLRSALDKGFATWLTAHQFDIVCVQETKAQRDQVDHTPFEQLGYHAYWHTAEKKGYSGVTTFTKISPTRVVEGCGIAKYDVEGRILRTDFDDWTLLNCYFPSGTTGDVRQAFKMEFLDDFFQWIQALSAERPKLIVVGDYNIAHQEIDIHDPKGNKKSSGFLPEERAWMTKWLESGFTDTFRYLNSDHVAYSWWSFRAGARAKNKGWRIDYQSVTNNLSDKLIRVSHLTDAQHSDHCPVLLEIDL
ncbi:MAG TPA: exodeoxyribonuclease III [Saprospiraceae bacterium]|nr:exodeoxyribonuclease III [Saprospiraceae bacterium]HMP12233.1 exodeoxyribonuclease III [Saprospiraceae bacterium]